MPGRAATGGDTTMRTSSELEALKALVRRDFEQTWNQMRYEGIDELFADSYVNHNPIPGFPTGREGIKQLLKVYKVAFPDMHFTVEDQIAEGDTVVTRWTMRGTHQGDLFGTAPTGRRVEVEGITIFRVQDGRIVERWAQLDALGQMRQLGIA
jgi:steroid delta-isomerase-like uncharacterized protein